MKSKKKTIRIILCIILIGIFIFWQNNALEVTNYTYSSKEIPDSFDGYRIVQISDLHNKNFGKQPNCLIEEIQNQQPDMIVVTGDLVDSSHTNITTAIAFLEEAVAIAPCYYITGNHELWLEESVQTDLMKKITETGTVILDDKVIDITTKIEIKENNNTNNKLITDSKNTSDNNSYNETFKLVGLDDRSLLGDTLHKLTKDIDKEGFVLLLAHEPQNMMFYSRENVDLILSGHAHGGQVRLPFISGLVAPDQGFLPKYTEGLHEENGVSMIISRGIGNSIIPIRIFNRPEVVCIDLQTD